MVILFVHQPKLLCAAQEVLRPPTFVQKMMNSRALEGDTVRLECKVDASPPPQLFWKKDKDMLRIDPNRMRWVMTELHAVQDAEHGLFSHIYVPYINMLAEAEAEAEWMYLNISVL